MKHCNMCDTTKEENEFGMRSASTDGLAAKCKSCQKGYDKERANAPHRIAARKAYSLTPKGIVAGNRAKSAYIKRNRHKRKAHIILGNALRDGKIIKQPCEVCESTDRIHAHHDDYSKPLDVRWLCPVHHTELHK